MSPVPPWLRRYSLSLFRTDVTAAVTVTSVLIPQSIAYAALAEMPPEYGLYASLVPGSDRALRFYDKFFTRLPFESASGEIPFASWLNVEVSDATMEA